jgi:hypothetical protein
MQQDFFYNELITTQTRLTESYFTQGVLIGLLGMSLIHLDKDHYDIFLDNIKNHSSLPEDVKNRLLKYKQ